MFTPMPRHATAARIGDTPFDHTLAIAEAQRRFATACDTIRRHAIRDALAVEPHVTKRDLDAITAATTRDALARTVLEPEIPPMTETPPLVYTPLMTDAELAEYEAAVARLAAGERDRLKIAGPGYVSTVEAGTFADAPRRVVHVAAGPVSHGRPSALVLCADGSVWSGQLHARGGSGQGSAWAWERLPPIPEPEPEAAHNTLADDDNPF
jgi:hypothetical protein